jgi:hypothetical protein
MRFHKSRPPEDASKMPQGRYPGSFHRTVYILLQRYVKRPLHPLTPLTPLPNKKGSLSVSRGSFSCLSNKSYFVCWLCLTSQSVPHEPILWPMKARTLNTGLQYFWWARWDTSPGPRSVRLSTKPAGVSLRCDREPLAPCWILLLGETPCWGLAKSRLPCATSLVSLSVPVFLRDVPVTISDQQLLANFCLMAIPALGGCLLPPCELRPSLELIRTHLMLRWRKPVWFQNLAFFFFPHLWEWRFCVADSVPVPLSGNDPKAHLIINLSSMCHVSQLCSPSSPRMSGCTSCPRQRWQTFFPDCWEQTLPQSFCRLVVSTYGSLPIE